MPDMQEAIRWTNEKNLFMSYNGIRVAAMENDWSQVVLDVTENSKNVWGMVHGGVYYTMADCAAGAAARSLGGSYVTLSGNLNFLKGANAGRITAEAHVVHRGRTTCVYRVELKDDAGSLLAEGNFTMFRLK